MKVGTRHLFSYLWGASPSRVNNSPDQPSRKKKRVGALAHYTRLPLLPSGPYDNHWVVI
jgi:hypothetical protein